MEEGVLLLLWVRVLVIKRTLSPFLLVTLGVTMVCNKQTAKDRSSTLALLRLPELNWSMVFLLSIIPISGSPTENAARFIYPAVAVGVNNSLVAWINNREVSGTTKDLQAALFYPF